MYKLAVQLKQDGDKAESSADAGTGKQEIWDTIWKRNVPLACRTPTGSDAVVRGSDGTAIVSMACRIPDCISAEESEAWAP